MRQVNFKSTRSLSMKASQGFTLIEIVVVMVILAILGGVVAPGLIDRIGQAEQNRAKADFKNLATALDLYRLDNSRYPTTEQGIEALVSKPTSDPIPRNYKSDGYLENAPLDPWGNIYQYTYPGERGKRYDIYTLGADGLEGGEDSDADIYNSDAN